MNVLKSLEGLKTHGGLIITILPVVLMQLGLTQDEASHAIASGTAVVGGVIAILGFLDKIRRKFFVKILK